MDEPLNMFAYHHVASSVERFVNFVRDEADAIQALLSIPNTDKSISHHGVNVASLSTGILLTQGLRDEKLINLVGLGSLLHDVDHHYSGLDISGDPGSFTEEKRAQYRAHPLEGARRIHEAKFIDHLVFNIITQHEEHMDGSGFPKKLTGDDVDPMVLVVGAANAYDRFTTFQGLNPKGALKALLIDKVGAYPLKDLQTLQNILKSQKIV
jgi:HD-GYP domain-containing protein (c-di-GMP phosphodiesterase class II)